MNRLAPIALLFALLAPAQARTLAGVDLPDTVVVDGATLRLNGMGLRAATALRVKAYVGGLYLEQPSSDAATVIDSHQRKRVTMKFLRDIDRQRLTGRLGRVAAQGRGEGHGALDRRVHVPHPRREDGRHHVVHVAARRRSRGRDGREGSRDRAR